MKKRLLLNQEVYLSEIHLMKEPNTIDDLKALRQIEMVIINGTIIKEPKVKKMGQVEKELDKFL